MEINLLEDFQNLIIKKAREDSFLKVPKKVKDKDKICIKYFEYLTKLEFAGPNQIKKSGTFECAPKLQKGLADLEYIIKYGGDIRPYLNKDSQYLTKYDGLYADWGVLHFHLGEQLIEGQKFVERDNYILFAFHKFNTVYFIGIYPHGHWTDKQVVQRMLDNWPKIFESKIVEGKPNNLPNDSEIYKARKAGSSFLIGLKDRDEKDIVSIAPNYGQTTEKVAADITLKYKINLQNLSNLQNEILKKEACIIEHLNKTGGNVPPRIKLIDVTKTSVILLDESNDEVMEYNFLI